MPCKNVLFVHFPHACCFDGDIRDLAAVGFDVGAATPIDRYRRSTLYTAVAVGNSNQLMPPNRQSFHLSTRRISTAAGPLAARQVRYQRLLWQLVPTMLTSLAQQPDAVVSTATSMPSLSPSVFTLDFPSFGYCCPHYNVNLNDIIASLDCCLRLWRVDVSCEYVRCFYTIRWITVLEWVRKEHITTSSQDQ